MNRRIFWQYKKTVVFLLVLSVIGICLKIISGPDFSITTVYIEGNEGKNIDVTAFNRVNNIFLASTANLSQSFLDKNPLIKSVAITKKYPHALYIKIIKRQAKYYAYVNSQMILFDEDGMVINDLEEFNQVELTEINCNTDANISGMKIKDENLIKILKIAENIKRTADLSINYIKCGDKDKYLIRINGVQFILKPDTDPNLAAGSLQVLFKQFKIEGRTPKVVDLRFTKPVLTYDDVAGDSTVTSEVQ